MNVLPTNAARLSVIGTAIAGLALSVLQTGADAAPWLSCADGTKPVFSAPYAVKSFPNGELRFQACRTKGKDIDKAKVAYVKRDGKRVEVALYWQWVTQGGRPYVTEGFGGGSPRTYTVSAGQTATFNAPFRYSDGSVDPYGDRPGSQYTCVRGAMTTVGTGDLTLTPRACF